MNSRYSSVPALVMLNAPSLVPRKFHPCKSSAYPFLSLSFPSFFSFGLHQSAGARSTEVVSIPESMIPTMICRWGFSFFSCRKCRAFSIFMPCNVSLYTLYQFEYAVVCPLRLFTDIPRRMSKKIGSLNFPMLSCFYICHICGK